MPTLYAIWRNYRRRFVPWLAFNFKESVRRETSASRDKIKSAKTVEHVILNMFVQLHQNLQSLLPVDGQTLMEKVTGYSVRRSNSNLPGGGTGVILASGSVRVGDVVALYPGTLYRRFEPLFLTSICNQFILRCLDGICVDGNDRFPSRSIYRSCVLRDSMAHYKAADMSWLTNKPVVPWNVGQYVNNGTKYHEANVAYQEVDLIGFPPEMDYLLPNIWYSGPRGRHIRLVALVAIKEISIHDEILSNYVTLVHPSNVKL